MGTKSWLAVLPALLFAMACSGSGSTAKQPAAIGGALQNDLDRAAAPLTDLASSQYAAQQVVSAEELTGGQAARAKKTNPQRHVTHRAHKAPKPQVNVAAAVEDTPKPEAPTVAEAPAPPPPQPTAGPRPTPNPVSFPDGDMGPPSDGGHANGGGVGGVIGTVIGVVIRGGVVDGDHCDPRGTTDMGGMIGPGGIGRHGGMGRGGIVIVPGGAGPVIRPMIPRGVRF